MRGFSLRHELMEKRRPNKQIHVRPWFDGRWIATIWSKRSTTATTTTVATHHHHHHQSFLIIVIIITFIISYISESMNLLYSRVRNLLTMKWVNFQWTETLRLMCDKSDNWFSTIFRHTRISWDPSNFYPKYDKFTRNTIFNQLNFTSYI